jgi:hypothetical protein
MLDGSVAVNAHAATSRAMDLERAKGMTCLLESRLKANMASFSNLLFGS